MWSVRRPRLALGRISRVAPNVRTGLRPMCGGIMNTQFHPALGSSAADESKSETAVAIPSGPTPRTIQLPLGGDANMFTREQMTILYHCSHGELGRLLVRKMAPIPIRVDGQILWFADEARNHHAQVQRTLERWRH